MGSEDKKFEELRNRMVDEQLLGRGISNPKVLDAFRLVPRHDFVPGENKMGAYADHPLPIGSGQTISQPYMVALMTENLNLSGAERVLEIGTGSGYQTAILAEICEQVYTIERNAELLNDAERTLSKHGYKNICFKNSDGTKGWEDEAPFDGIMVTAASPKVPKSLKFQIGGGGRMVIPVGSIYSQILALIERAGDDYIQEDICSCVFVPLVGEEGWPELSK